MSLDHAGDDANDESAVNLPNALTIVRLACDPIMAWLLVLDATPGSWQRCAAGIVFLAAALTDLLDGAIARATGTVTTFGKVADPIADKALTGVALVALSIIGDLSWWITAIIVFRELGVTALRLWVIRHGIIPASRGGKVKTLAQILAIAMYLFAMPGLSWWHVAAQAVMGLALVLTVATGVDYVFHALRLRKQLPGVATKDGVVR